MKCIIHIGTEKTATTLIQKWLYANKKNLSDQGVALMRSVGVTNNRKLVSYVHGEIDDYLRDNAVTNQAERAQYFSGFSSEFSKELAQKAKTHSTFLFSSEHFHSRLLSEQHVQRLKDFLDGYFTEYEIVCYFREQSKARTSLYSTALRSGQDVSIEDFHHNAGTDYPYYNYLKSFGFWETVFGKEHLRPRIFDKAYLKGGDILKDFLATALPGVNPDNLIFQITTANESLSQSTASLFRLINSKRPKMIGRFQDNTPSVFKGAVLDADYLDSKTPIYDPRQSDFYDLFNESNVEFFGRYFGEHRNLFSRPEPSPPTEKERLSITEDQFGDFLSKLLSNEQLTLIENREIDFLRDLAKRLVDSGTISSMEAKSLLKIASRARPKGVAILRMIEEISLYET